jgi:hypothetical protein
MSNLPYPLDGSDFERGAWALATGFDATIVCLGAVAMLLLLPMLIRDIRNAIKYRKP